MTWNPPISKVICSVSDSVLECSAPNVNYSVTTGCLKFLCIPGVILYRAQSFLYPPPRMDFNFRHLSSCNTLARSPAHAYSVNSPTPIQSDFPTTVDIVSDLFPNRTENLFSIQGVSKNLPESGTQIYLMCRVLVHVYFIEFLVLIVWDLI